MKQLTLQDQYNLIQEGKGNKEIFLKAAKKSYPNLIRNSAGFDEAAAILKKRSVISENLLGIGLISQNNTQPDWFSIFNNRMKNLQEEAKIEERKPTKEVVDLETQGYNYKDKSNSNNNPGFFQGFYTEMKDPKNCEKSVEEITEMVSKNLAKDPLFYVKDGQFGVKGIGYTDDVPGLGMSKEPQGKYKSSGYGDIKESLTEAKKKNGIQAYIKEIEKRGSMAALEAKMSALDEAIEERKQKLSSIEENEDIAEFINQSSLKEIQREIKELEKVKEGYAKIREKMVSKKTKPQREVIKENPSEGNVSLEQIAEKVREILREYHKKIDKPFDDNFVRIEGDKIYFRVGFWEVLPEDLEVKIISGLSELNIGENSIEFSKEDMYGDDEQVDQYEIVLSINNNIGENLSFRSKGKSDTVSKGDVRKVAERVSQAQLALEDLINVYSRPNISRDEFIRVLKDYNIMHLANDILSTQPGGFSMNEAKLRKVIRNIIRETLSK